ncbi:MAG TPA: DNA-formamidopyrimidine glycosylase family protein [Candidatus Dormibacteraeota bacterium]|nr:DNA-formamidopyrimidine glycosylase family protein [Candidatus Dormibacteraeota bacterium]
MPELPFLEVLAENLASRVSGRRIESILIRQPALLQTSAPAPESFVGEFLSLPGRVGKYLILETESRRAIVIHLMRAGRLAVTPSPGSGAERGAPGKGRVARGPALPKHLSARIAFDDGTRLDLVEHGKEKRARLWLAEDSSDVPELGRLGPDPSRGELTYERFRSAMEAASRRLKTFLTDQRAIAGIGNGLSDEILYEARLSPMRLTGSLTEPEARALHLALLAVVSAQTEKLRESMSGELPQKEPREHYRVHDHAGTKCPRCGAAIARVSFADHDIFYCPGCQTGGKPLKDRRLSKLLK